MLDKDFMEIKRSMETLKRQIKTSMDNYKREGFENQHAYRQLENFERELDSQIYDIEKLTKETRYGKLTLRDTDGRYEIYERYFTSGSPIEVETEEDGWCMGRVESRHEDGKCIYYFLNYDGSNVDLAEGMHVRVRIG